MKISVIIPVYNAAPFVKKAVESALQFEEVEEVFLIEDGSDDNSLEICEFIASKHKKVKVLRHADKKNHGAGASRNLGINNASNPYIAFLDADDFYLPNRFEADTRIFDTLPEADGVYSALGFHYYSECGRRLFKEAGYTDLFSLNGVVAPEELSFALLGVHKVKGDFSIVTLTVKKELIEKCGYFNEKLRLHQDTDFTVKLSLLGKLYPGDIKAPVAMYGVHDDNRVTANVNIYRSRTLYFKELLLWAKEKKINKMFIRLIESHYLENKIFCSGSLKGSCVFVIGILKNKYFLSKARFFNKSFQRLFGNGYFSNLGIKIKEKVQISFFKIPV